MKRMKNDTNTFGFIGIIIGSIALMLALVHFWAGPFSPQPTLETAVADKVSSIRKATIKAIKGEEYKKTYSTHWDMDKITDVLTAILGGLAFILSVFAFAKNEPKRVALGGAALGISAISFQFIAMYAMALLAVILIAAVLSSFGLG